MNGWQLKELLFLWSELHACMGCVYLKLRIGAFPCLCWDILTLIHCTFLLKVSIRSLDACQQTCTLHFVWGSSLSTSISHNIEVVGIQLL